MKKLVPTSWKSLQVSAPIELRLEMTLLCGQVFLWKKRVSAAQTTSYLGIINSQIFELQETTEQVMYRMHQDAEKPHDEHAAHLVLQNYFHLQTGPSLATIYKEFAAKDPIFFGAICSFFPGVRVIRQDPFECLMSFICSSNNNVSRITLMITRMMEKYGTYVGHVEDAIPMYAFPTMQQLQAATEAELKELGFGYRAAYICKTCAQLAVKQQETNGTYFQTLHTKTSQEAVAELATFHGVGNKVAACVALYSLDKFDLVPQDVHILRMAKQFYGTHLEAHKINVQSKTVTNTMMVQLMNMFRNLFGPFAGYAQMILYGSQLAQFRVRLPEQVATALFGAAKTKKSPSKKRKKAQESDSEASDKDDDAMDEEETEIVQKKASPSKRKRTSL